MKYQVHKQNVELWEAIVDLARKRGLRARINSVSMGGYRGMVSYIVHRPHPRGEKVTLRREHRDLVVACVQAPYARRYRPSVRGERIALEELIRQLYEGQEGKNKEAKNAISTTTNSRKD